MSEEILKGIYEQLGSVINEIHIRPQVALNTIGSTMVYIKKVLKTKGINVGPVVDSDYKFLCTGECTDVCTKCGDIMECQFVCENCGERKSIECIVANKK